MLIKREIVGPYCEPATCRIESQARLNRCIGYKIEVMAPTNRAEFIALTKRIFGEAVNVNRLAKMIHLAVELGAFKMLKPADKKETEHQKGAYSDNCNNSQTSNSPALYCELGDRHHTHRYEYKRRAQDICIENDWPVEGEAGL